MCSGRGGHDDFQSVGGEAERTVSAQCVSAQSALPCFLSRQASSVTFSSSSHFSAAVPSLSVSNPDLSTCLLALHCGETALALFSLSQRSGQKFITFSVRTFPKLPVHKFTSGM